MKKTKKESKEIKNVFRCEICGEQKVRVRGGNVGMSCTKEGCKNNIIK